MGGQWSVKNLKDETKFKPKWKHQPTVAMRIPFVFRDEVFGLALLLDSGGGESEAKSTHSDRVISEPLTPETILEAVRNWELEKILKLQAELPAIIDWKKEQSSDRRLEQALVFLAKCCDGANSTDGAGFNKCDTGFGKWLAGQKQLVRTQAQAGLKMVQKYKGQLERAGLSLPEWDAIAHQYPVNSPPVFVFSEEEDKDILPERRVEIKGDSIAVYAPYDSTGKFQRDCKSIKGYKFEGSDKSWRFPLISAEEAINKLTNENFIIAPEVEGAIALARQQRELEQQALESAALEKADEIVRLVKAANLDAPLSNGWLLRDYQKSGVEWLLAHRKGGIYGGGILADDMGLGKTLTALYAAKSMQFTYSCAVFIVAPVSLMEGWRRAAEIAEVVVELFSNNYQKIPAPLEAQKYVLICDEAHGFQDINSKRSEKMLELAHHENCLTAWMLTGTPIKNGRPINLMPLLMAVQHPLVADKWAYQKRYCNAHHKSIGKKTVWDATGAAFLDELAKKTEDVILRRKKSEVLSELPPKTRLFKEVELDSKAEKAYSSEIKALVEDYRLRAKRGEVDEDAEALVTLNILRKVGSVAKVSAAVAQAEELLEQGQQVVIFTEFLKSAQEIHAQLMALGVGHCELLTGETRAEERQAIVDHFQSGESKVFVGTIKAGGVGLTLTAASNVILVDRAWTPGDVEQAEDRTHRLGQQNAVFATWLQLGQIDHAIDDLILQKSERIELILQGKRKTLKGINSPKDLAKELLAIL
ncbi:DEAD/DEAH box helicase [Iningainema sp. BLCCT55]|uniref:DEAD/DEAH box helicase n=2 Tax=Iningainema TaxID=1932705 RepID=A0A8J6XAY6_9CYAN|nr:DEAD/DEAH box helicase [Iningainema tapete]MBD2771189.1 DEAD/DEAH box helicase [Iningainema tapete BLCC-T55]